MKRLLYTALFFSGLLFGSCGNDFLDRSPISNMNEQDFFKTEKDIELAMISAYSTLHTLYGPESMVSFFGELMSDNAYSDNMAGNYENYLQFQNANVRPDNSNMLSMWENYYTSMFRINQIISRIDPSFKNARVYEAEMRFLRALYYFDMVRAWDRIALVNEPLTVAEAYALPLSESSETYASIIEDLDFCASTLPEQARLAGTPTSGAANALLGKVYLTMGRKTDAVTALNKVYGKYKLVEYADLWDLTKKNNAESIFEIQYKGGIGNPYSTYWAMFTPYENNGVVTAWGMGVNQATEDLWNAYEEGDPRRELTLFEGYYAAGEWVNVKFAKKWVDTEAELSTRRETADNNFIVLRYADVLLMLSEATGKPSYLNEVRARVGLPGYGTTGYPPEYTTVDLAVEHERQVEFGLEFHRLFDLKRTGRAVEVLKNSRKNLTVDPLKLTLPIPLDFITQNPGVVTQNPGYTQ